MSSQVYQDDQGQVLNSRANGKIKGEATTVHSTTNYSRFRFSNVNRPLNEKHLERLYEAISTKNLLDQYPILVSDAYVVLDGQHRLKVAEALRVPIYYQIANNMSIDDIRMINDVNLKWTLADYLHYWSEMGNQDYVQIDKFCKKHPNVLISFIAKYVSLSSRDESWVYCFKSGRATARRIPDVEKVIVAAYDFKPYLGNRCWHQQFLYAIQSIMDTPGYKHETMMTRLEYQSTRLVPCVKTDDYIVLLSDIYNYRTREQNKLDFMAYRDYRIRQKNRANQARNGQQQAA